MIEPHGDEAELYRHRKDAHTFYPAHKAPILEHDSNIPKHTQQSSRCTGTVPDFPKDALAKDTRCFTSPHVCAHIRASPCCSKSILLWPLIDNWSHHRAWLCTLTVFEGGREHGGMRDCGEWRQSFDIKKAHIWLWGLIFNLLAMAFQIGFSTEHTAVLNYRRVKGQLN